MKDDSEPAIDPGPFSAGPARSARIRGESCKYFLPTSRGVLPLAFTLATFFAAAQAPATSAGDAPASAPRGPALSILYFDNIAKAPNFDWLRVGLSDMLTTDIVASGAVTVVERERLAKVLAEQQLQMSGLIQDSDAVRVGEMLAATKIVYGSFVISGESLRIEARLVDTRSAVVVGAVRAEGPSGEVLELERKIAAGILDALGIASAPAPSSGGTSVPGAAAAYYHGLAALDAGSYNDAASLFQKAAGLDPAYSKPQAGLEAAYRFLKDFKRQREQHEMAVIAASLQRLRSRVEGAFYSFGDMVRRPRDYGFADAQAATAAYTSDPRGYSGDSPVQAMWNMQMLFLEMGQKAVDYFSDTALADRCDRQILDLAAAAEARYPKDPFLPECLYAALLPLRRESRWVELKNACEKIMTGWPDYRMASSVEDLYQTALDKLSGKE
jgi:TolB-like protein